MTDPWDIAAKQLKAEQEAAAREEAEATRQRRAEQEREEAEAEAAYRELQIAIEAATPALTQFLGDRGAAAQRLLAAAGEHAFILFGSQSGGGAYVSVVLDGTGLRKVKGVGGDYGSTVTSNEPTTPEEAVEFFAYYGQSLKDPNKVRDIVSWLTEQINGYAGER